jgi:hypothetical protein
MQDSEISPKQEQQGKKTKKPKSNDEKNENLGNNRVGFVSDTFIFKIKPQQPKRTNTPIEGSSTGND